MIVFRRRERNCHDIFFKMLEKNIMIFLEMSHNRHDIVKSIKETFMTLSKMSDKLS